MIYSVVGVGYVGLSLATLLSTKYKVYAVDIQQNRVEKINNRIPPINDEYITKFFNEKVLDLYATTNFVKAYKNSNYIIIATPTDYNEETHEFDTSSIELVIENVLEQNPEANIIIKSTVPIGYTESIKKRFKKDNIVFSPEFLREGRALYDNVFPSRIIIGSQEDYAVKFANTLSELSKNNAPVLAMNNTEAEAVKLFSNTYLAMRVSFFNELDTYAETTGLNAREVIEGVGLDPRIGPHYNNPSFGYGGYCLPKDTKQMRANFDGIPNDIISAIVDSNVTRKKFVANQIIKREPKVVGVYKLAMKKGSDNFRAAAIFDIIKHIEKASIEVIIYEPSIKKETYDGFRICNDFCKFSKEADVVIVNRMEAELEIIKDKVYTRDLFNEN